MGKEVNRRRHFLDFLKVGRVGSKYKVFGAPGNFVGPYDNPQEAEAALEMIIANTKRFSIVNRQVVDNGEEK